LPQAKTAEKSARSAVRKAERNKSIRSETKTRVTIAEKEIAAKKGKADGEVVAAISALDRAAKKKVIHRNTAARKKSRLMKKLHKAGKK
jgi:small subunit ribosomal protein S20